MKAKVNRIFVVDGIEYRIKENQEVAGLPKNVIDQLVLLGLVYDDGKSAKKTGRRKK